MFVNATFLARLAQLIPRNVGWPRKIKVVRPREVCNQFDGRSKTFMSSLSLQSRLRPLQFWRRAFDCQTRHATSASLFELARSLSVPSCAIAKFVSGHLSAANFSEGAFWHRTSFGCGVTHKVQIDSAEETALRSLICIKSEESVQHFNYR